MNQEELTPREFMIMCNGFVQGWFIHYVPKMTREQLTGMTRTMEEISLRLAKQMTNEIPKYSEIADIFSACSKNTIKVSDKIMQIVNEIDEELKMLGKTSLNIYKQEPI